MLDKLKEAVCRANVDLAKQKLGMATWGNVSGIDRKSRRIVIKPSGVPYERLRPADMVVLELDGTIVEGDLRPSTDTPTHLVLYRAWEGIGGVVHTHSIHATMFAQALKAIRCFGTTHADYFRGEVPVTRELTEAEIRSEYEANTGRVILERFKALDPAAMPGVLVARHAPFAWGKGPAEALDTAVALEFVAQMAYGTMMLNPGVGPAPGCLVEKHYNRKHGAGAYYGQKGTT